MKIRMLFSVGLLASAFTVFPQAHADDALTSLTNRQEVLHSRIQSQLNDLTKAEQKEKDKIAALKKQYDASSVETRAKLQKRIAVEQEKLKSKQEKLESVKQKYKNSPEEAQKKLQVIGDQEKQKIQGEMDKLKAKHEQNSQEIRKFRDQQKQDIRNLKDMGDKVPSHVKNLANGL